ncbi:MAG: glutathione peroxidase [Candidatus Marinimicrobia bacterium]|nr:glutathione peroxidase [Candidatus Neomarinimicrobiota bacterium]|tara:strand:- start:28646 stop:29203 length:558 start_codon:yes stop_codon:yes gene_type:complete
MFFATPVLVLKSMFTKKIIETRGEIAPLKSIYEYRAKLINGEEISFKHFKGKKLLFVNVASKCGYTPQYKGLQRLHEEFGEKVAILGFPADNFGGQEPGSNKEIEDFCSITYGITFPIFSKISVKGKDKHPIFGWLTDSRLNGWNDQEPTWNFCKYLVNEEGQLVKFYKSSVKPLSDQLISDILQ